MKNGCMAGLKITSIIHFYINQSLHAIRFRSPFFTKKKDVPEFIQFLLFLSCSFHTGSRDSAITRLCCKLGHYYSIWVINGGALPAHAR